MDLGLDYTSALTSFLHSTNGGLMGKQGMQRHARAQSSDKVILRCANLNAECWAKAEGWWRDVSIVYLETVYQML